MPFRDAGVSTHLMSPTDRFIGFCEPCIRPVAVEKPGALFDTEWVGCPQCGHLIYCQRIYGTLTVEHTCDDSCQGARGVSCECACGGANHGIGFLHIPGEATRPKYERMVARYRTSYAKRSESAKARASAKREAKQAKIASDREAFKLAHADVFTWLDVNSAEGSWSFNFATDLLHYFGSHATLTDGQVAAVRRSIAKDTARAAKIAAEAVRVRIPAPMGKQTVTGTVKSVKAQEFLGDVTWKMLVEAEAGWKVWSTIPASIQEELHAAQKAAYAAMRDGGTWIGESLTLADWLTGDARSSPRRLSHRSGRPLLRDCEAPDEGKRSQVDRLIKVDRSFII